MKISWFEKREQPLTSLPASLALIIVSVVMALLVGAAAIALTGVSPLTAYQALFYGAYGRLYGLIDTLVKATPLLLAGLGVTVAFRAGIWNIGAEGQLYMGALFATWAGLNLGELPASLLLPLAILAGFISGGLWGLIPGILKAALEVNEVIISLMLNYIAIYFVSYLVHGPMEEVGGFMPQTPRVAPGAQLPLLIPPTRLHAGIILALVLAVVIHFVLWRTTFGYRLRAIGANPRAARYGGIKIGRNIALTMFISGGLAGLAGANEVLGIHYRLLDGISPGYGFTAIVVALLGKLHPLGVVAAALLFASLSVGADMMQRMVRIPIALAHVIQALVVLFVLGTEILLEYTFTPLQRFREGRKIREKVREERSDELAGHLK